jgi:hypothetical protein
MLVSDDGVSTQKDSIQPYRDRSVRFGTRAKSLQQYLLLCSNLIRYLRFRCSLGGALSFKMKKFIAGVVVGFVASCGVGFAASSMDHNGVFWNKLDGTAKTGYIHGYGDAMQVSAGKLDSLSIAGDLFHWRGSNKIIKQISHELSISELTPEQAVKKLDTLYANPKYSELDLGQAMQLLTARAEEASVSASTPASAAPAKVAPPAPVSRSPIR